MPGPVLTWEIAGNKTHRSQPGELVLWLGVGWGWRKTISKQTRTFQRGLSDIKKKTRIN